MTDAAADTIKVLRALAQSHLSMNYNYEIQLILTFILL